LSLNNQNEHILFLTSWRTDGERLKLSLIKDVYDGLTPLKNEIYLKNNKPILVKL